MPDKDPPRERALDQLVDDMYRTLHEIARRELGSQSGRRSLDPTELLHECYVKLAKADALGPLERTQFVAIAAKVIRHVLVDRVREERAHKRGRGWKRVTLHEGSASTGARELDLLALDEALQRLSALDEMQARVVELRFFGGLSHAEVAETLGLPQRTAENEWAMARAWLRRELSKGP